MSGIVVLIGYIFLIPSVLGMVGGTMGIVATGSATEEVAAVQDLAARKTLEEANVPAGVVTRVMAHRHVATTELERLTADQRAAVDVASLGLSAGRIGAGAGAALAGGASFVLIVMSLVGGLLGWLLVMKKRVLQCTSCSAVVAAS